MKGGCEEQCVQNIRLLKYWGLCNACVGEDKDSRLQILLVESSLLVWRTPSNEPNASLMKGKLLKNHVAIWVVSGRLALIRHARPGRSAPKYVPTLRKRLCEYPLLSQPVGNEH